MRRLFAKLYRLSLLRFLSVCRHHVHDHAGIYQISHLLLVEQAFVIYRYGASVFLHGEPCLAMLLFGSIVFLRGLHCSFACIHSLRC